MDIQALALAARAWISPQAKHFSVLELMFTGSTAHTLCAIRPARGVSGFSSQPVQLLLTAP